MVNRSLTAALGFAVGDAIAQHATRLPGRRYDYSRTMRMSGFGLLFAGPLQGHYWFRYLDKVSFQALSRFTRAILHSVMLLQVYPVEFA